jgi:hypothetical protein
MVALESSRNEANALKIAYNYANDKYNEIKVAYDKLIGQLKEEVRRSCTLSLYTLILSF